MAELSNEAIASILVSFEKKLDLITMMLARQQDAINKIQRRPIYTLNQTVKRLRVELKKQKDAYDELERILNTPI